jgi:malate synthase
VSIYDALYASDVLDPVAKGPFDEARAQKVVSYVAELLDKFVPLSEGSHTSCSGYTVADDLSLSPPLKDPSSFVGFQGEPSKPTALLFCHNDLHIHLSIDAEHKVGKYSSAGVSDVVMESATTAIVDLEDSAAVADAEEKVGAYTVWSGLMRGDLEDTFEKGGKTMTRKVRASERSEAPCLAAGFAAAGAAGVAAAGAATAPTGVARTLSQLKPSRHSSPRTGSTRRRSRTSLRRKS